MSGLSQGVRAAAVGATTFGGLALITAVGLATLRSRRATLDARAWGAQATLDEPLRRSLRAKEAFHAIVFLACCCEIPLFFAFKFHVTNTHTKDSDDDAGTSSGSANHASESGSGWQAHAPLAVASYWGPGEPRTWLGCALALHLLALALYPSALLVTVGMWAEVIRNVPGKVRPSLAARDYRGSVDVRASSDAHIQHQSHHSHLSHSYNKSTSGRHTNNSFVGVQQSHDRVDGSSMNSTQRTRGGADGGDSITTGDHEGQQNSGRTISGCSSRRSSESSAAEEYLRARQLARCCAWLVPSLQVDDSDGTFTDHENATSSSMHGSVAAAGDEVEDIDWNSSNRRGSTNHAREGAEEGNRPRTSSYGGGGNGFSSSGRCLRWLRGKGCGSGGTQPLRQKPLLVAGVVVYTLLSGWAAVCALLFTGETTQDYRLFLEHDLAFSLRCAAEPLLLAVLAIAVVVSGRLLRHRIKFSQGPRMRWVEVKITVTATLASLLLACRAIAMAIAVCLAFSTHPAWWWTENSSSTSGSSGSSSNSGNSSGNNDVDSSIDGGEGDSSGYADSGSGDSGSDGSSSYWHGPGPGLVWTSVLSSCVPYGGVVACLLFIMKAPRSLSPPDDALHAPLRGSGRSSSAFSDDENDPLDSNDDDDPDQGYSVGNDARDGSK